MTGLRPLEVFAPAPRGGHPEYVRKLLEGFHAADPSRRIVWPVRRDSDTKNRVGFARQPEIIPVQPDRSDVGSLRWLRARANPSMRHDSSFLRHLTRSPRSLVLVEEVQQLHTARFVRRVRNMGHIPILHIHNVRRHDFSGTALDRAVERDLAAAARKAASVIVHTREAAEKVRNRFGTTRPVCVIPHGMTPRLSQSTPPPTSLNVVFYGVNRPNKGLANLVAAMNAIPLELKATLTVAGVTPADYLTETQAILSSLRHALVWRNAFLSDEETEAVMRSASLIVLPYTSFEAQSGVLHLAMEWGVPVVASDLGGMSETLKSHGVGLLVPPDDVLRLRDGILRVAGESTNAVMRENAVRAAQAQSWRACGEKLSVLLRDLEVSRDG